MTADRNSSPAEAEMVLVPREATPEMLAALRQEAGVSGYLARGGPRCWAAILTAAPKATETPGLREAAQAVLNGAVQHSGSYFIPVALLYRLRAALSATPQPVADPDDGAGRDEVTPFVYLREHDMRELAMPASQSRDGIRIYRVPEANGEKLHPLYGEPALSAECAANEQTRREREIWKTAAGAEAEIGKRMQARAESAEANVARLHKAQEEALAHIRSHFPGAAAEFEAVYEGAAARSSREEGK